MATLASGASITITLQPQQVIEFAQGGSGQVVYGPGNQAGQSVAVGASTADFGPFPNSQVLYVTATSGALTYNVYNNYQNVFDSSFRDIVIAPDGSISEPRLNSLVAGGGILLPNGVDDTVAVQTYIDQKAASGNEVIFGGGDFIITGPIVLRSERTTQQGKGIGLKVYGQGAGNTRIFYSGPSASPLFTINAPASADIGLRNYLTEIGGLSLIRAISGTNQIPSGTTTGSAIVASPVAANNDVLHTSLIKDVFIDGFSYPLTLSDSTLMELDTFWAHQFLVGVRFGYNVDLIKIRHSMFGSEQVNQTATAIAIQTGWSDGFNPPGGENCVEIDTTWFMKLQKCYEVNGQGQAQLSFTNTYFEACSRYLHALPAAAGYTVHAKFESCEFSLMNSFDIPVTNPSLAGYGAKIHFEGNISATPGTPAAGPAANLTIRDCTGTGAINNSLVSFNNPQANTYIKWESNVVTAGTSGTGQIRCTTASSSSYVNLPNAGMGTWNFGDGTAGGLVLLSGDERQATATVGAGATYSLHPQTADTYILTLPDGNCTIDAAQYQGAGLYNPRFSIATRMTLQLIIPASITGTRTITWGSSMKGFPALSYSAADVNKRVTLNMRGYKNFGEMLTCVSPGAAFS